MISKIPIKDIFGQFTRIDIDAEGGYARVFKATSLTDEYPVQVALKICRPELLEYQANVIQRYSSELSILSKFNNLRKENKSQVVQTVPELYGSGFLPTSILNDLEGGGRNLTGSDSSVWLTGTSLEQFDSKWNELKNTNSWLPFLIIELADFDASLYRRILANGAFPQNSNLIKVADSIGITVRLLDLLDFLHENFKVAYLDWKPEHVFWNQRNNSLKLIDWNVYSSLEDPPYENALVRDDIRLLIGSTLYSCLTLSDFGISLPRPLRPHPTTAQSAIFLSRNWSNPINIRFPIDIDKSLAEIVRSAITDKYETTREIRDVLVSYLKQLSGKDDTNIYALHEDTGRKNENLMRQLENAYYDGDYSLSIQLAHFLLEIEPANSKAREYLQKAENNTSQLKEISQIPRDAMQYYRRARSYIAARDIYTAVEFLGTAIHLARQSKVEFLQAKELLEGIVVQTSVSMMKVEEGKTIKKPKVFLSYARDDAAVANEIYEFLVNNSCDPWIDKINLTPGQDWHLEIQKAIRNADFFVACLSTRSVSKKGYIQKELKTAFEILDEMPEGKIFFIPIRLDDCEIPDRARNKQWLDWNESDSKSKLLRAMATME